MDGQRWSNAMFIPNDDGSLRHFVSPPDAWFVAMLSPDRFLLSFRTKEAGGYRYRVWRPDDAESTPVPGLEPTDPILAVISAHELLVTHSEARSRIETRIVDVDTGAVSPITGGDESGSPVRERYVVGHRSDGELIFSTKWWLPPVNAARRYTNSSRAWIQFAPTS